MIQQMNHWYQTKCLNEEGQVRSGIKWAVRAGGIIALASLLTSCGNNWRMYEHPGSEETREYTVDMDHVKESVSLGHDYCAQTPAVKEDVRNFIEDCLTQIEHRYKTTLTPMPRSSLQDPLCHAIAKKALYFIDNQRDADKFITDYEMQEAKNNIDDFLK